MAECAQEMEALDEVLGCLDHRLVAEVDDEGLERNLLHVVGEHRVVVHHFLRQIDGLAKLKRSPPRLLEHLRGLGVGLAHFAKGVGAERELVIGRDPGEISRKLLLRSGGGGGVVVGRELGEKCVKLRLIVDGWESLGRKFGRNSNAAERNKTIALVMCFTSFGIDAQVLREKGGSSSSPLDCVLGRHRGCRFGWVSYFSSLFIKVICSRFSN